jgi:hypothetical protein
MPKWLRILIFNAVRAYSFIRRGFYRIMDQLAAMLARGAMPSGLNSGGSPPEAPAPMLSGSIDDASDREVCVF